MAETKNEIKKETEVKYTTDTGFKINLIFNNDEKKHEESIKAIKDFFVREISK